jgi:DNA (cytosine-5)-methyltransferase 1
MINLIYIDLFCGAGGTSSGVHNARINGEQCAIVAACINHDANAIRSHKSNHKQTLHFTEDITVLYDTKRFKYLVSHVEYLKSIYPDAEVVLWASLECTNFSKAKGGQAREADSRTLANHLFPYIEALKPDRIQIENVEEFMSWGALDENGKPISRLAGIDYLNWINRVKTYGYHFDHRILNAADFGALTSRKRFFGQFAHLGETIYWPEQTHAEKPHSSLFGETLKPWRAVKEVLDFTDEGESIFDRKKDLVEATLERIYAGLVKFVAGGQKAFLAQYYSGRPEGKVHSVNEPSRTITTFGNNILIQSDFLSSYYGNGDNISSIEKPCPTLTTKDRVALIQAKFIVSSYSNGDNVSSVENPCPAITTNPKQNIVSCWIMNPQFASAGGSIDKPCFTLIARMDEMPPYLISTDSKTIPSFIHIEDNNVTYNINESDSEILIKIKEFMALYGILDIKMRMLRIPELKKIMGFGENYTLIGTQADQKKFIGNAVEVHMATALVESTAKQLTKKAA